MTKSSVPDDPKTLESLRDELQLQAHLFKAEARTKLERLENRWHELERLRHQVGKESTQAAQHIAQQLLEQYRLLKDDLRK